MRLALAASIQRSKELPRILHAPRHLRKRGNVSGKASNSRNRQGPEESDSLEVPDSYSSGDFKPLITADNEESKHVTIDIELPDIDTPPIDSTTLGGSVREVPSSRNLNTELPAVDVPTHRPILVEPIDQDPSLPPHLPPSIPPSPLSSADPEDYIVSDNPLARGKKPIHIQYDSKRDQAPFGKLPPVLESVVAASYNPSDRDTGEAKEGTKRPIIGKKAATRSALGGLSGSLESMGMSRSASFPDTPPVDPSVSASSDVDALELAPLHVDNTGAVRTRAVSDRLPLLHSKAPFNELSPDPMDLLTSSGRMAGSMPTTDRDRSMLFQKFPNWGIQKKKQRELEQSEATKKKAEDNLFLFPSFTPIPENDGLTDERIGKMDENDQVIEPLPRGPERPPLIFDMDQGDEGEPEHYYTPKGGNSPIRSTEASSLPVSEDATSLGPMQQESKPITADDADAGIEFTDASGGFLSSLPSENEMREKGLNIDEIPLSQRFGAVISFCRKKENGLSQSFDTKESRMRQEINEAIKKDSSLAHVCAEQLWKAIDSDRISQEEIGDTGRRADSFQSRIPNIRSQAISIAQESRMTPEEATRKAIEQNLKAASLDPISLSKLEPPAELPPEMMKAQRRRQSVSNLPPASPS